MKLNAVVSARSIWLCHLSDLNPHGQAVDRDIIRELASRYSFAKVPNIIDLAEAKKNNQPVVLQSGQFNSKSGMAVNVALTMYQGGMSVDTSSSTSDCDDFLHELFTWLHTDIGLLDYKTIPIGKFYVSELYVSTTHSLNIINPKFERFAAVLAKKLSTPIKNPHYEVGALAFWIDPEQKPQHVHFRIERQIDVAFSENRYYSIAPLETHEHLSVLELLEQTLRK